MDRSRPLSPSHSLPIEIPHTNCSHGGRTATGSEFQSVIQSCVQRKTFTSNSCFEAWDNSDNPCATLCASLFFTFISVFFCKYTAPVFFRYQNVNVCHRWESEKEKPIEWDRKLDWHEFLHLLFVHVYNIVPSFSYLRRSLISFTPHHIWLNQKCTHCNPCLNVFRTNQSLQFVSIFSNKKIESNLFCLFWNSNSQEVSILEPHTRASDGGMSARTHTLTLYGLLVVRFVWFEMPNQNFNSHKIGKLFNKANNH